MVPASRWEGATAQPFQSIPVGCTDPRVLLSFPCSTFHIVQKAAPPNQTSSCMQVSVNSTAILRRMLTEKDRSGPAC